MASTIQLKTGTGSAVPSSLTQGEVAINIDNGLVYYGSGSGNAVKKLDSFTHITASGTISAAKLVVTEITSSRITSSVVVTSGSNIFGDTIADTHTFNGHITGSNISASGTGSFGMLIIDQNITASGNISSSGNIIADDANFDGTIQVGLGGTNTDGIKIGPGGSESFLTNINGLRLQPNTADPTNAVTPHVTVGAGAHITASGNISSSATGSFGMLFVDQNITASNISASGTILSENITVTYITRSCYFPLYMKTCWSC